MKKPIDKPQKQAYNVTHQITKEDKSCLLASFITFICLAWAARLL